MYQILSSLFFAIIFFLSSSIHVYGATHDKTPNIRESVDSFKMLAWNIYMLPPMLKFTGKKKRAKAIGDKLTKSDYDVIVFEEAFNGMARRRIWKRLKDKFPYTCGPAFKKKISIKTSSGVWILSQHPMKELGKTKFREAKGVDRLARKGALMVQVEKAGQKFQIIGTHLNDMGPIKMRLSQLKQIRDDLLKVYGNHQTPIIIAGDYNIYRYKEPQAIDSILNILGVKNYHLEGARQYSYDVKTNDLAYGGVTDEIDYAFFRPGDLTWVETHRSLPIIESIWKKGRKYLSDHNPLEFILFYKSK